MTSVLHAISSLEGGGAERQLAMLATEQVRRGWTVHVAMRRGGVHEDAIRSAGAVLHSVGDLRGINPLLVSRLGALVRRLRPDVMQTWLPQMDVVGGIVARLTSVPWVLSERTSKEGYRDMRKTAWLRAKVAPAARAVVANSVEGATYWEELMPRRQIEVIPNALDLDAIRNGPPMSCQVLGGTGPVLLFVGRLHEVKAPDVMIEAMRRLSSRPDVRVLLIGDGPLREVVRASIAAHDLHRRVRLLPYQPDWWGLLKTATALVSTSRHEGQPNVVLEAMGAGCPLIVSDIPGHRAILDEDSALIVPRDDPDALAAAIDALVADPAAAARRRDLATQRVLGLTIQHAADAYERVYARCIAGRHD